MGEFLFRRLAGEKLSANFGFGESRGGLHLIESGAVRTPNWIKEVFSGKLSNKSKSIIESWSKRFDEVNKGKIYKFTTKATKNKSSRVIEWTPDQYIEAVITGGKKTANKAQIKNGKAMIEWSRETGNPLVGGPELQKGLQPYGPESQIIYPKGAEFQKVSPTIRERLYGLVAVERGRQFTNIRGQIVDISLFKQLAKEVSKEVPKENIVEQRVSNLNRLLTGEKNKVTTRELKVPKEVRQRPVNVRVNVPRLNINRGVFSFNLTSNRIFNRERLTTERITPRSVRQQPREITTSERFASRLVQIRARVPEIRTPILRVQRRQVPRPSFNLIRPPTERIRTRGKRKIVIEPEVVGSLLKGKNKIVKGTKGQPKEKERGYIYEPTLSQVFTGNVGQHKLLSQLTGFEINR